MSDWEKGQSHNITLQIAQYVRAQSIWQALWTILWRLWSGHTIGLNSPNANIYVNWNILERKAKIKVNKTLAHATALNAITLLFTFILPVVPQKWHYQYCAWLLKSSFWSRLALDRELGANSDRWEAGTPTCEVPGAPGARQLQVLWTTVKSYFSDLSHRRKQKQNTR